jgi:hypothetical protein
MGQEQRDEMDVLRGIAAQVQAATAEASAVVDAVDHFLGEEFGIGVSVASRPFDSQRVMDNDRELVLSAHLAYGRVQGKDRIYVLRATFEKNEWNESFGKLVAEDRTPWSACPREVRLQSFALLPELLANLAVRVEEVVNQTTRTSETVRGLIQAMKLPLPQQQPQPRSRSEAEAGAAPATVSVPVPVNPTGLQDQDTLEDDDEPENATVPLQELTINAAPNLFKRPRGKVG